MKENCKKQQKKNKQRQKDVFEKCCNFYPNNFKFCAVKKNFCFRFTEFYRLLSFQIKVKMIKK